jgi:hypothetical protein
VVQDKAMDLAESSAQGETRGFKASEPQALLSSLLVQGSRQGRLCHGVGMQHLLQSNAPQT